jgi:hypothetical protein
MTLKFGQLPVKFLLVARVNKPLLGNKAIEVKGNSQGNRFRVRAHLEVDVLGRYVKTSSKGLGNKS